MVNKTSLTSKLFASSDSSSEGIQAGRFNTKIDLDSEKVVNNISLTAGEKCVVCRCWKSAKFPLCDGSHVKYNKETGDNLGPAIIVAK